MVRWSVFALLLLSLAMACRPAGAQALLPTEGFNKIPWGASLAGRDDFHALASKGDVTIYARDGGDYRLGGFGVVKVFFAAKNDIFFGAYMRMRNMEMFREVQNSLRLEYGDPQRESDMSAEYLSWNRGELIATMRRNKINDAARMSYTSPGYADEASIAAADSVFDNLNFSNLERDSWVNPKRIDLDVLRQ